MSKIMVCDDEQEILDITCLIFEDEGYEVTPVLDSRNVEGLMNASPPDLLLIDLWMPHLSGDKIIQNIRLNGRLKKIPVIVFSASRDGKKVALQAGANDFLEKPFDITKMTEMVERYLHNPALFSFADLSVR